MFPNSRSVKPAGRNQNELGSPNTVVGVSDATFKVVHYYDDRGRPTNEIVMEIDGILYTPVNSIEWCSSLRRLSGKQLELIKAYEAKKAPVKLPTEDTVEVVPLVDLDLPINTQPHSAKTNV